MHKTISLLITVTVVWFSGCATTETAYGPRTFDAEPLTAIVVAYEPEMIALVEAIDANPNAEMGEVFAIKGVRYRIGTYQGEPVIVFATGMSIANAAMSMQMAFDYFPIKEVIYMGIAGAVNPQLQPGDVTVPARWYYHDESVYVNPDPNETGEFIEPDYYEGFLSRKDARRAKDPNIPNYKPFGMIHPDDVLIIKEGMTEPKETAYFSATPRLLEATAAAIQSMPEIEVLPGRMAAITVGGNGVTGSVFVDNREYRKWIRDVFNAEVTEMESAAIGQVCHINDIDWVIIRAVSDLAGGQEGKNDENIYDVKASRGGAAVLFALLDELMAE
ncbi:MAG: 5'-methylthioadenosine/S-adenosylhomocysteine nucleosidase [Verrucomicrobiota bacterium]